MPDAPVLIGLLSCFLVRLPLIRMHNLLPDVCLTGLALIGTGVTISEYNIGAGPGFWFGMGFGALGSSLIEIGKGFVTSDIKLRFQKALRIMAGMGGDHGSQ